MTHQPTVHSNTRIFPASLDPRAVDVVTRLTREGFEAYLVGGCVRDLLLGHIPKDFDVSTAARPRQIRRIFRNCRVIGRRFKLAHVHFGDNIIEVATFRQNPTAENTAERSADEEIDTDALLIVRDNVFGTAEEDSVRRDFTINALLYDVNSNEVIDYVGGFEDIENKVLRTIGEPAIRFAEDPVRMLRAIKFTSRLDLTLEPSLAEALHSCAELIDNSSPARVIEEIFKLLACGRAEKSLAMLLDYGLLQRLLPELAAYWAGHRDELVALGRALDFADGGKRRVSNAFLLAVLFHDPFRELQAASEGVDAMVVMSDLVAPAALRTSIPRRDVAHMKHMLVTQLRLERNRRGRRFRMSEFLDRPSTHEAVELLYVRSLAGAVDPEKHAEWALRLAYRLGDKARPGKTEKPGAERPSRQGRRRRSRGGRSRQRDSSDREPPSHKRDAGEVAESSGNQARHGTGRRRRQPDRETHDQRKAAAGIPDSSATSAPTAHTVDTTLVESQDGSAFQDEPGTAPTAGSSVAGELNTGGSPGGFKGLVRSIFRKVFDSDGATETAETPAPGDRAADEQVSRHSPSGDEDTRTALAPSADSSASADVDPDEAASAGRSEEPQRSQSEEPRTPARRRRRRRRRSRGSAGQQGEDGQGGTADEKPAGDSQRSPADHRSSSRNRKRGGRRRQSGKSEGQAKDREDKPSSSGKSRSSANKSRGSRGRSDKINNSKRPSNDRRSDRQQAKKPRVKQDEQESGSQRHPEDIEDTFDW